MQNFDVSILKEKIEEKDRQMKESLEAELLNRLKAFNGRVIEKLNTTESVMDQGIERLSKRLDWLEGKIGEAEKRDVRRSWMLRIALLLMTVAGIYGYSEYMGWKIARNTETMAAQNQEITRNNRTLAELKEKTWGIQLVENRVGRFVMFPKGVKVDQLTVGDQEAVRLREGE